jgi:hypothetical protein
MHAYEVLWEMRSHLFVALNRTMRASPHTIVTAQAIFLRYMDCRQPKRRLASE